mgnify:CR=1 FL=1
MNVLLDLDGTLTDPREGIVACLRHALAGAGCECPSEPELARFIGPPLHDTLRRLVGDGDPERGALALRLFRERFATVGLFENAVYAGIPAALAALRETGANLFLATSKPRVYAERIVDHFGLGAHFQALYGSELDGTRAGKGELLAHLMASEALAAGDTFMVGDREHDMLGAAANGLRAIGALWGYGTRQELLEAGACALCEVPEQLGNVLATASGIRRP